MTSQSYPFRVQTYSNTITGVPGQTYYYFSRLLQDVFNESSNLFSTSQELSMSERFHLLFLFLVVVPILVKTWINVNEKNYGLSYNACRGVFMSNDNILKRIWYVFNGIYVVTLVYSVFVNYTQGDMNGVFMCAVAVLTLVMVPLIFKVFHYIIFVIQ